MSKEEDTLGTEDSDTTPERSKFVERMVKQRLDPMQAELMRYFDEGTLQQIRALRIELTKASGEFNGAMKSHDVSPMAQSFRTMAANVAVCKLEALGKYINDLEDSIDMPLTTTTFSVDGSKPTFDGPWREFEGWAKQHYWPAND
ncbi:MAG: hypothetical protein OXG44_05075 [Gammaproteobacteria bacterium]|nr:hypothetical protein [Gammaproteobacteria bacterium]